MLTREEVLSVYRQVLGRAPGEGEIAAQLGLESLDALLRLILGSEEYELRLRERTMRGAMDETFVNAFHPDLARWGIPPGTRSADGAAVVGHEGWLFLAGGNYSNTDQHRGAVEVPSDWLERWQRLLDYRVESARGLGIELVMLLLPDKLAVYEQYFPEPLEKVGPRPVERLLAGVDAPLLHAFDELAAAAGEDDVFIRTDHHVNFRGMEVAASLVLRELGIPVPDPFAEVELRTYPVAGDLGVRFDPPVVSLHRVAGSLGRARLVEDNRDRIQTYGGHLGTRRVYANERAPDPRVAAVFGSSHSFASTDHHGLCWFLAQVFREVHFLWAPFSWDSEYLRRIGAEVAVMQSGDRLVQRVPRPDVDLGALAEDTLRHERPVDVERILD
jgi:alginate O-acetyltransferase complex protein AlgJ